MSARLAGNLGTRGLEAVVGVGFSLGEMRNAWSASTGERGHLTFTLKTFPADVCSWSVEGKGGCRGAVGGQTGCPGGRLGTSLGWWLRAGRGAIPGALEGAVAGCAVVRAEGEAERTPEFGVWAPPRKELPCPKTGPKGRGQSSAGCQSVSWMSGCLSRDTGSSLEFRSPRDNGGAQGPAADLSSH